MKHIKTLQKALMLFLLGFTSMLMNSHLQASELAEGHWRGELVIQKNQTLTIGIIVRDGGKSLVLESPLQGMYERAPTRFELSSSLLSFEDEGLSAAFEGKIEGDVLTGIFTQGKAMPLTLYKLSAEELKLMEFEGKYSGDLIINSSSTLPLVLHVAVLKEGFAAALDSPAQNSFGIPISEIEIDEGALTFTSPLLNAKYVGKTKEDSESANTVYEGTFIQGMPMPLTLTKVSAENAHLQYKQEDFGSYGGSIMVIDATDNSNDESNDIADEVSYSIQRRYFGDHNGDTQYEIGSITKTFVAYLLAQAHTNEDSNIRLDTTLDEVFADAPALTMLSLATHTSGLERNPPSLLESQDRENPFSHITREMLKRDLKALKKAKVGEPNQTKTEAEHEYSNYAFAVLGEVLVGTSAESAEKSLSGLLDNAIFTPLAMDNSYLSDTAAAVSTGLAQGHSSQSEEVKAWYLNAASGAGAIVSTLKDMRLYATHLLQIARQNTQVSNLLFNSYSELSACCQQGLGWMLKTDKEGKSYAWHNGMTGGFSTFIGFYLDGSRAVIMLNNQAVSFDGIAHNLLTKDANINDILN